jgi:cob(I)alamin adenosyltransferase
MNKKTYAPKKKLFQGMIQVYTGDGKGKTTAALGLACRAIGHGYKVLIIQFLKGKHDYGELKTAKMLSPHLTIRPMGRGCRVNRENPDPEDIKISHEAMLIARKEIVGRKNDVVILDEINVAVDLGLVQIDELLSLLDNRPPDVELILTGRYAPAEIIKRADLVTEMVEIKHYYQQGIKSREGIER